MKKIVAMLVAATVSAGVMTSTASADMVKIIEIDSGNLELIMFNKNILN